MLPLDRRRFLPLLVMVCALVACAAPGAASAAAATASYSYDAAGNLLEALLPNGCAETSGYDRSGRLMSLHNACNSATVSRFTYTLDAVGNPTMVDSHEGTLRYGYDNSDRLVSYTGPGGPLAWSYDPVGNRLSETRPAGTTSYSYNAADQLTESTGPGGVVAYTYDLNGNQTAADARTFSYDLANRLISTTLGADTVSYSYDGDGKRLSAQGATTTSYLWDTNASLPLLALERDGTGATLRRYSYGAELLALTSSGADFYYLRDGLGSVINLANAAGVLQWSYGYEPYGALRLETQNDPAAPTNLARFTGQLYDPATGLYHLRARDYDPTTGRFLQTDPLERGTTDPFVGAYVYADNQPTTLIDPSGMASEGGNCGSVWCWFKAEGWQIGVDVVGPGKVKLIGKTLWAGGKKAWSVIKGIRRAKDPSVAPLAKVPARPDFADPSRPPGAGWEWRGSGPAGSNEGAWYNPRTGESLHPDLSHPGPIGAHYDYVDPNGNRWRLFPDGRIEPT